MEDYKFILAFEKASKNDVDRVGGKAANLGEMIKQGLPIPEGFTLTTLAYEHFIAENNLGETLDQLVNQVNEDNLIEIGEKMRSLLLKARCPEPIKDEVVLALKQFDANTTFSVRSSATAEDMLFASFAGQQDTYLNIKGQEEIIQHIIACWASLYTDRAILYRKQNHIESDKVTMAVVIQKMVRSEKSGVMFTANPLTGNRSQVTIEACYGLGEALVSGLITPDRYCIHKEDSNLVDKEIANKHMAIYPLESGGTQTIRLSVVEGQKQVLTDVEIETLMQLARLIEGHYGAPQDIEWCFEDNMAYIVQSRAITSLFPLPSYVPEKDAQQVYISINHMQSMINPMSPLGLDILPLIFRIQDVPLLQNETQVIAQAGGRLYINLTGALSQPIIGKKIPQLIENIDVQIGKGLRHFVETYPLEPSRFSFKTTLKLINLLKGVPFKVFYRLMIADNKNLIVNLGKACDQIVETAHNNFEHAKTPQERLETLYNQLPLLPFFARKVMPALIPGIIAMKGLEKIAAHEGIDPAMVTGMAKGLEGNVTTEMGLIVGDMADAVRESETLIGLLKTTPYENLSEVLEDIEGHESFKIMWQDFLTEYGCRANGEIDIAALRWSENPEQIVRSILSSVESDRKGSHRIAFENTKAMALKECKTFISKVKNPLRKALSKRLIKVMRASLPGREHHKLMLIQLFGIYKAGLLKDAEDLVNQKRIEYPQDIFDLRLKELYLAYQKPESLKYKIFERREAYKHYSKLTPPRVMTGQGQIMQAKMDYGQIPENALVGAGVSAGVYEGIAHVIHDPAKESLKQGEILVASFTDPSWTTLFLKASALVMEVGGLLTHGTVVAREYGLPAVVGVDRATQIIKTGNRIRVDGNNGIIEILEDAVKIESGK